MYTNALDVSCEITNSIFIIYNSLSISIIGKHLQRYDMIFRIGTATAGNKVVPQIDPSVLQSVFTITEKAPTSHKGWAGWLA